MLDEQLMVARILRTFGLRVCRDCGAPYCRECGKHSHPLDGIRVGGRVQGANSYGCTCGWWISGPADLAKWN